MSEKKIQPQDPKATPAPQATETDDKNLDRKTNTAKWGGRKSGRKTSTIKHP